eukprot:CAMPEP_0175519736 /NCGR_PEP_ID=MMETSP0096-20121207/16147_1 /TAXON_ID=311494 /ORGANISM="Alexandrium monilatum, Strain CCMP3105" /LENGTH=155 /DNA_ID=CAMNT_0016822131 /DNA_START=59 /DNA_END=523 /DNA_ORIENTATION=+
MSRAVLSVSAAAVCLAAAGRGLDAFLLPAAAGRQAPVATGVGRTAAQLPAGGSEAEPGSWGFAAAGIVLGAHVGLAVAARGRSATKAAKETAVAKYSETAADKRLFEKVFMDYTSGVPEGPHVLARGQAAGLPARLPRHADVQERQDDEQRHGQP